MPCWYSGYGLDRSIEYQIGRYLESNWQLTIRKLEMKILPCMRRRPRIWLNNHYPACISIYRGSNTEVISLYWRIIIEEMKREYPEIIMEAYLLKEEI
jgi:hypothetical protein